MSALFTGLLTGLSLIVAIGAQNAYVLRRGLSRQYVGLTVGLCAGADIVLIFAGIGGVGAIFRTSPTLLEVVRWVGVAYLMGFAIVSFRRAIKPTVLLPTGHVSSSRGGVVVATLSFTFLNPHVYIDTVLLLGSIGNQYGANRWSFGLGAALGSIVWFASLGFGARAASSLMARPTTWRILDTAIGVVMLVVALDVATLHLG